MKNLWWKFWDVVKLAAEPEVCTDVGPIPLANLFECSVSVHVHIISILSLSTHDLETF